MIFASNTATCFLYDGEADFDSEDEARSESGESDVTHQPPPLAHACGGTCTEVARSCSWAYTKECMCTAGPPDIFGLFSPCGCVAVVAAALVGSKLGGRELSPGNMTAPVSLNVSLPMNAGPDSGNNEANSSSLANTIVEGSHGFYNASTGAQIACPCNVTCVSYDCCGSTNGMGVASS